MHSDPTRRQVLRSIGVAGSLGVAGCLAGGRAATASVLSAGSLSVLFEETVGPAFEAETGYRYRGEFHGSNAIVRMVEAGQKRPDVLVSADVSLLRQSLPKRLVAWDVVFASNEVVIAYDPETTVGRKLAAGEPWYRAILESDGRLARSDPDLDPLGYRTVQLFELAERYYGIDGLAGDLRSRSVVDPSETHLLASVETGERSAAVAYANMAVAHDMPYISLPDRLNFAEPALADHYATATYTTDEGTTVAGTPVQYAATVMESADNVEAGTEFLAFVLDNPSLLREGGLVVPDTFPRPNGPVPEEVLP